MTINLHLRIVWLILNIFTNGLIGEDENIGPMGNHADTTLYFSHTISLNNITVFISLFNVFFTF